ncbi:acyl dehydratase [Rhodococcus wratislaviensis]|uniref:Beta-hydroxyacyl-[acyl-carrier- protein] dehydratase subunit n=1 Tax=Rhodococcus wratislaviensis TaxID=44752 RepID=A0AB38FFP9_RHOWR|nr:MULTISPECIES: MaoC family dehydratase N-terminal domain-containing protein [Rhodococcus]REE74218.1 acyl dehydratase [Rhodococcus wratislaviensis]WAM17996.1 MaoC family dehydratase N-terminal domain-containing protein [Rhodococcus sp. JS3073]SPZ40291.1 putative beta-hydroxyacyl-[acyl-carrier- protein] dehydratase subunit [Rhodococcus wratislaviensis]
MSLDRSVIGREFPAVSLLITRSRLQNFAKATGQHDPVYLDPDAAKQAGHRDLPVPPTFVFGIELEAPNPFAFLEDLDVDLRTVLHGEQQFDYHRMAYAGDELTAASRITDIYEKKGGLLEFIVRETTVTNQDGARVAVMRGVTVVQNRPGKDAS